jgi:hypothetical protein
MSNLTSTKYPGVTTRPGYSVLGAAIGSKVLGLGVWKGQELHAIFNDGTWRKWNGSSWVTLTSGLSTTADASFTNFQGNLSDINLFMTNGTDQMRRYDGSTISTVSGAPVGSNFITTYQNRLWVGVGKELHACALDNQDEWSTFSGNDEDSYVKDMESTYGESINMLSGSLTRLTIGMPNSIYELYGGVPSAFNTHTITDDEGVVNNKSAVTNLGIMTFMHSTGIFEYPGGTLPDKDFSDIVRTYYPSISSGSATGSDGHRLYYFISPDTMLVYDPRDGINVWSVWNGIQANCFALMNHVLYIGDNQGRVLQLGGMDSDNGTPISWYAITKPFNNQSLAQKLRWYKLWIVADVPDGSTFNVSLSPSADGNDWVDVTPTKQGSRYIIPVTSMANENYIRIKLSGTGPVNIQEITRQQRQLPLY